MKLSKIAGIIIGVILLIGSTGNGIPPFPNIRVNDPAQDDLVMDYKMEHTTQNEPAIAVFGENIIVAFVDTGHFLLPLRPGVRSLTGYSRSTDGGTTFHDLGPAPSNERGISYSDPTLAVSSDGVFYLANLQLQRRPDFLRVGVARSDDGGQTFNPPVLIPLPPGAEKGFSEQPQVAVDPETGFVYVIWIDAMLNQVFFSRSTDGGQSFSAPIALSKGSTGKSGARLAVGPGGHLYALWFEHPLPATPLELANPLQLQQLPCPPAPATKSLYVSHSLDRGHSWSEGRPVATIYLPCEPKNLPQCRAGVRGNILTVPRPSPAVDPQKDVLYIAFQSSAPDGSDNADIYFMALDKELEVLIPPKRVNNDATHNDQFMPALAVSPQGEVGIMFYDRRLDPNNELIDVFFARSMDGGITFSEERVTSVSFPVPPIAGQPTRTGNFDDLRRECYMGDYNDMVADARFFYLVWGDNRNFLKTPRYPEGRADPDVYFAKIPTSR